MEYRRVGGSGLKVSALSFGAWVTFGEQVGDDTARDLMRTAREAGVNFFDNAETYADGEAELMMGRVIQHFGWKRSDLVLSTKIFWGGDGPNDRGLSHKHIVEGTLAALDRLQTSYVDLIFCHRPDLDTPIEETVRAMSHLIDRGLAFYWGTSEWSADQIRDAYGIARREHLVPPTMEQPQYNMFTRDRVEKEYARLYDDIGLGLTTFSPLASGNLAGKYLDGVPRGTRLDTEGYEYLKKQLDTPRGRDRIEKVKRLIPIAEELGASVAQLAIAWAVRNPRVSTVITGASRPAQIIENMKALELSRKLGPDLLARIEAVLDNAPKPAVDFREQ